MHFNCKFLLSETSTCIKESVLDELNTIASHSLPVKDQIKINYANNIDRQLLVLQLLHLMIEPQLHYVIHSLICLNQSDVVGEVGEVGNAKT